MTLDEIAEFERNNQTIGVENGENDGIDQGGDEIDSEDETSHADDTAPATSKKPSSIDKLLGQRNEAIARSKELEARNKELEGHLRTSSEVDTEYFMNGVEQRLVKQQMDQFERLEKSNFYDNNPKAKDMQEALEEVKAQHPTLSYSSAYKLYLAENGKAIDLVDPAELKAKDKFGINGQSKPTITEESTSDYEARMLQDQKAGKKIDMVGK